MELWRMAEKRRRCGIIDRLIIKADTQIFEYASLVSTLTYDNILLPLDPWGGQCQHGLSSWNPSHIRARSR